MTERRQKNFREATLYHKFVSDRMSIKLSKNCCKGSDKFIISKNMSAEKGSVTHTFHTGSFPFWVFKSKQVQQMTNDKWTLGLSSICLINLMQTKLRFNSNERPHGIWESRWQSTISSLTKNYITISMQKNQFDLNSLRYSRFQSLLTMST